MPIEQSNRGLTNDGRPPDKDPDIARAIADAWHQLYLEAGKDTRPIAHEGVLFRASDAGGCARNLGYNVMRRLNPDEPGPSNPPSVADQFRMDVGSMVHDALAPALARAYGGDAEVEVEILRSDPPAISMHIDIVIRVDGEVEAVVEVKTMNGYGFKKATLDWSGPPTGPRFNAVVQGALAAYELQAKRLVILYFALENLGPDVMKRNGLTDLDRFVAQWSFTPEEYRPIAEYQHKLMVRVQESIEAGILPPRTIFSDDTPTGNRIVNPAKGEWQVEQDGQLVNIGNTWMCGYCWDRDRCIADGPS